MTAEKTTGEKSNAESGAVSVGPAIVDKVLALLRQWGWETGLTKLKAEAEPGLPCVSRPTYELVRERFEFKREDPRLVDLKGLGVREAWDVTGERK